MKILIVGAGFTGCTLARLMKEKGNTISIKEKTKNIGGLSYTKKSSNGLLYEPYGARTFHTKYEYVKKFVQNFAKFNNYVHNKGIIINGILRHYPLSIETIKDMSEGKQILKELDKRQVEPIKTNFETYMISLYGFTLYKIFIYNYTKKMWGIEPKELTADWVMNRIELREINSELFISSWQGVPVSGYTKLLEKMTNGIPIEYNCSKFDISNYDLVLFSGKIDELLNYKFGVLPYRSLRFEYTEDELWENEKYGTINLPQHPKYIRKANFKVFYQQKTNKSWIQYQESVPSTNGNIPMYPIYTKENKELFDKYLKEACKSNKLIPVGRLGLYKYLNMDHAVSLSMEMIPLIESWKTMKPKERYHLFKFLLLKY